MKYLISFLFIFFAVIQAFSQAGQGLSEGKVTYISAQNVYVRFSTTEGLKEGDTLFTGSAKSLVPAMKVLSLSSTSCVCSPLDNVKLTVSQPILTHQIRKKEKQAEVVVQKVEIKQAVIPSPQDTVVIDKKYTKQRKQLVRGRISANSYSDISNMTSNTQSMRYGLSLNVSNISDSRLSAETYVSFYVKNKGWEEIKKNIFNGLKIYSLNLKYELSNNATIWFGRRINPRISNMGAVDGLQFEMRHNSFTTGFLLGSRPDDKDYSFNANLLQYGAYVSHDLMLGKNLLQNTLAFVEQKNSGQTDRRFLYFQHNSNWFKNLNFFGSAEFDIYKKVIDTLDNSSKITNSPKLTNLYLSLRYNVTHNLNLSLSYSERQNIIYYETYKNIVDQLLAAQASIGYRFSINYHPWKKLSLGINTGYSFQKRDPLPSKNIYGYSTYSNIPFLKADVTASITALESSYLKGMVYSLGLSRDIIPDRLNLGLVYRLVDYNYVSSHFKELQNVGEINLDLRIYRKLSLAVYYEGTIVASDQHNRIYLQLMQRF